MPKPWYSSATTVEGSLAPGTWYWSPLWEKSHLLGRRPEYAGDDAWCGRSLIYARDNHRLYIDVRTSDGIHCADCRRYEKEKS